MRKDTPDAVTGPPFRRLLVANRGEIAVRVIRACRELGVEAVAVYSEADADALHVRLADRALPIGPASPSESYLDLARVIDAARAAQADAVHPGYGFLSESPALAEACELAGITFVGPDPATLAGLGDKVAARNAARGADVPVVPGTVGAAETGGAPGSETVRAAAEIGFPLLVKAAGGGGGRGMRRVDAAADLAAALESASREAAAAFGDGTVYLEKLIEPARHVEVQLLGDGRGRVIALGERDCSVQRRHQKLVEEAPAPGLTVDARRELHAMAVRVAARIGLRNAATAEFLLDGEGRFWFLEVNARLQVEHGITELVSGLDLVHEQMRIAAGGGLSDRVLAAADRLHEPDRHAIEVRLSAEDPGRGFAPAPGRVTALHTSAGPGVRVDSGVESGDAVWPDYDPLLAKLMVVAEDRPAALARMRRALDETHVFGVPTTLAFHRWLIDHPPFTVAQLRVDMVDRDWPPPDLARVMAERAARLAVAADRARSAELPDGAGDGPTSTAPWAAAGRKEGVTRWP